MKLTIPLIIFCAINIGFYLFLSFVIWDLSWPARLVALTPRDRGALFMIWVFLQAVGYGVTLVLE